MDNGKDKRYTKPGLLSRPRLSQNFEKTKTLIEAPSKKF